MKKLAAIIVLLMAGGAFAQTSETTTEANTSTIKKSDVTEKGQEMKKGEDEITNARLKAEVGSKSKYSFKSSFSYSGGSIEKPFGKLRPQLSASSTTESKTKISGAVALKVRLTEKDDLSVGTGVGLTTPGHSGQKGQVEDPYVSYGRSFKAGGLQQSFEASVTQYTSPQIRQSSGAFRSLSLSHTLLGSPGDSKWELGLALEGGYTFYSDDDYSQDIKNGDTEREDVSLGAFPFVEYPLSDKASFRTVYRGLSFNHLRGETGSTKMYQVDPTQSLGIGFAASSSVYLYPNVQWVWADMRTDKTNVALTAFINL